MQYPLTLKALEQMESSYEEYGGVPDEVQTIIGTAARTIKDIPGRTDGEKDALIASVALMYSADFTAHKTLPKNLAEYGDAVKANLEEALAQLDNSTAPKSPAMAQITAAINGGHYTLQHPLALKALKQMESSYEDYGGVPDTIKLIVEGTTKAIKELVDRPEAEKDALLATVTLMFSTDVTVYKEPPHNIGEFGDAVKTNLEDAIAQVEDASAPRSRDMMQVGLALAIGMKDSLIEQLGEAREAVKDVADTDPRLLNQMIRKIDQLASKRKNEADKFMTGEQPRLEARAMEVIKELETATFDLIKEAKALAPPPSPPRPPTPAHP